MRLLNVHSLNFTTFHNTSERPNYVIASHRWYAGDETSFSDFRKRRNVETAGYKKVADFTQYVKDNLPSIDWLWIDTCCIDSKSTTEVSEAINSMFRWYQEAEVCLAYLYDVQSASDTAGFTRSEWFRRGWTLQELLAPSIVIFLATDWSIIGHKATTTDASADPGFTCGQPLNEDIAMVTSIPETVLSDYSGSDIFTPEQKLTWLANRRTTRPEDISYCMLGILRISMNIRYGDGGDRTRARLIKKLQSQRHPAANDRSVVFPEQTVTAAGVSLLDAGSKLAEEADEVVLGSTGFLLFATELSDNARLMKRISSMASSPPASFTDIAHELDVFAQTLSGLETNRQVDVRSQVDAATTQQCIKLFDQALRRVRCALRQLQDAVSAKNGLHSWSEVPELRQACHELDGARTSIILGYELYNDAQRKLDTKLVLSLLSKKLPSTISADCGHRNWTPAAQMPRQAPGPSRASTFRFEAVRGTTILQESQNRRAKRPCWRIRFTPWFTSKVWEISLAFTPGPSALNLVPYDAAVMQACAEGDLRTVQILFREGKASPNDYRISPDSWQRADTLLSQAASSGNIGLCRYLIEEAGCPPPPNNHHDPLSACIRNYVNYGEHSVGDEAAAMYSILLSLPDHDDVVERLAESGGSCGWWLGCPDSLCLRKLKARSSSRLEDLSWPSRVYVALMCCRNPWQDLTSMYLEALGVYKIDQCVATACAYNGETILHVMARRCHTRSAHTLVIWADFIRQLIDAGANIHQSVTSGVATMSIKGETPLVSALRSMHKGSMDPIRAWITLLQDAGVDLAIYGSTEASLWTTAHPNGVTAHEYRIRSFTFGSTVENWSVATVRNDEVHIYRLDCPPGSMDKLKPFDITTICWTPLCEELRESWPWNHVRSITRQPLSNGHSGPYHNHQLEHDRRPAWAETEDDADQTIRSVYASRRVQRQMRSNSLPLLERIDDWPRRGWNRAWTPPYHKCVYDGRLRFGRLGPDCWPFAYNLAHRRCAKGLHDYGDQGVYEDIHRAISREMHSFRRRYTNPEELQALPYAAYHRYWRNDKQWKGLAAC